MSKLRIAVCQMEVHLDPAKNFAHAAELVHAAAQNQAEVVILPEMFHIPYSLKAMKQNALSVSSEITAQLSQLARQEKVLLFAGSIAEKEGENYYNTSLTFAPDGKLLARYRKLHLFDIAIPGKASFTESALLSSGDSLTVIRYGDWSFAPVICYDIRFPELIRLLTDAGAQVLVVPASFARATGEMHWEITMRCRAVDNQIFVAAASTARSPENAFQPWAHSIIVDPWGNTMAQAQTAEEILYAELDSSVLQNARTELPLLAHRHKEFYTVQGNLPIQQVICPRRE